MKFPIKWSPHCLAALTLSCVGMAVLPSDSSFYKADTDPQTPSSHRGSGRVITQVPSQFIPNAVDDTDQASQRLFLESESLQVHRGSGRGPMMGQPDLTAYRGSGRVTPSPVSWQEWA